MNDKWTSNDISFFSQYVFIFVFKGFGGIDEDFFARFSLILITMFWILYDLVFMLLPGKMSLNYYMCTGEDPDKDFYQYKKVLIVIRAYLKHHDLINDLSSLPFCSCTCSSQSMLFYQSSQHWHTLAFLPKSVIIDEN